MTPLEPEALRGVGGCAWRGAEWAVPSETVQESGIIASEYGHTRLGAFFIALPWLQHHGALCVVASSSVDNPKFRLECLKGKMYIALTA